MLKRNITYEDFNGDQITEVFYFNLTKSEMIELETEYDEGLEAAFKRIASNNERNKLITEFKRIILLTVGEKSADGKHFVKTDEIRKAFQDSAAFDALFMELVTSDDAAVNFIKGFMPKDMAAQAEARMQQDKPIGPPPVPVPKPPLAY